METKLREKCTYVDEVRDPYQTSVKRWTSMDEAPSGYALGYENNPHARKADNSEGRKDLARYRKINKDEVERRTYKDSWLSRKNTPYCGTMRYHNK